MFLGKRKNGIYFVDYFDKYEHRSKRISTGSKSKREALKFLSELEKKISNQPKIKFKTLSKFQNEYITFIEKTHSKSYLKSVKLSFRQFELYFKKDVPLFRILIHDTQSFITDIFQRAEFSARLYRRTLNAAFNRAVDWEYLVENPFRKVKLGRAKRSFPIFINEHELNLIIKITANSNFTRYISNSVLYWNEAW